MGNKSNIEWTDATWNPVRGCSVVSEGCRNCYAMQVAARFSGPGLPYEGLAYRNESGAHWTGQVRLIEQHLGDPIRWQRPRRIFVNSMSDLFHAAVSDAWLERIFQVMFDAKQHTFQVLTKRPERMLDWISRSAFLTNAPLPNVWLGVSVEDQKTADERIPPLLETPAAVRFISAEPLLGPVDISKFVATPVVCGGRKLSADGARAIKQLAKALAKSRGFETLDWVIVGAESGHDARQMDLQWPRLIVEQCKAAGVSVFVKQLGAHPIDWRHDEPEAPPYEYSLTKKGGDIEEFPVALQVREYPEARA